MLAGQAVLVATRADPVPGGGSLAEVRFVQPVAMLEGSALRGRLLLQVTADLEGLTMRHGELAPGDWGEGYVDRRHPHAYVHEMMVTFTAAPVTIGAGRGFVPFGTDDPMSRPVLRYPVNHHLSQILERALALASVRAGPAQLEGALFDGDEPEYPGQWPALGRFGDSWSVRLTVRPAPGGDLEWQGSAATVHSPEQRAGAGTDQHKTSTSARLERSAGRARVYALAEWARTSEAGGVFVFHSVLAEAAVTTGPHRPYYRFERTERPEEQRTVDLFRTVRPHLENSIIGTTRWTVHTAGYGFVTRRGGSALEIQPFVEASLGRITAVGGGLFDPVAFYGRDTFWSASLGVRAGWRMAGHRMGRYGVPMGTMHPMEPT